jgi:CheY-like chemotaxis protein
MEPLISIIDDDEPVRTALQRILASHGWTSRVFTSAEQFLASDQLTRAGCLIVDVRMPGMSGLQLHQHLVAAGYHIPTILITGCPTPADRDAALAAGRCCRRAGSHGEAERLLRWQRSGHWRTRRTPLRQRARRFALHEPVVSIRRATFPRRTRC